MHRFGSTRRKWQFTLPALFFFTAGCALALTIAGGALHRQSAVHQLIGHGAAVIYDGDRDATAVGIVRDPHGRAAGLDATVLMRGSDEHTLLLSFSRDVEAVYFRRPVDEGIVRTLPAGAVPLVRAKAGVSGLGDGLTRGSA